MSEGLLLVTNDGQLAHKITHPSYEVKKVYEVTTVRSISEKQLNEIRNGLEIDNELLKVQSIDKIKNNKHNTYQIILKEGRYRHIRRILKTLHIPIIKLKRTHIGPISIDNMRKGEWRYLTKEEIGLLYKITKSEER
jgi:23S rRNA pseudouridine2605 synthase